jgi:hypothetical protein
MSQITTADLVADIREMSGLKNNKFFNDDRIASFASDGAEELNDILILAQEHYSKKEFSFTLTNLNTVLLPSDFYKESLLELNPTNPYPTTIPMLGDLSMKNYGNSNGQAMLTNGQPARQFLILGDELQIIPPPNASGDYKLTYVPQLEKLVLPNPITLDILYPTALVNVTIRFATSQYLLTDAFLVDSGNTLQMHFPETTIVPFTCGGIDFGALVIGDLILIRSIDAPGDNVAAPTNMGIYQYEGAADTTGDLIYSFGRYSIYNSGATIAPGLRVKINEGFYSGEIWVSNSSWHINTNVTTFSLSIDQPFHADLITTTPLLGDWQSFGNTLLLTGTEDPDLLHIDGEDLTIGDIIYMTPDDAPIDPTNAGIWLFDGTSLSSGLLYYNFTRPSGLQLGDVLPEGLNILFDKGVTQRGVTFVLPAKIILGTTINVELFALDQLASTGKLILQNAEFDPSFVNGTIDIIGSPLGDRAYLITSYIDESTVIVAATDTPLIAENFGSPTTLFATKQGTRDTLPQVLSPWALYIKIHASIAIQEGRGQGDGTLERKLEGLKKRVGAMVMNRTEDVRQAPITHNRRRHGAGGGGGWFGF